MATRIIERPTKMTEEELTELETQDYTLVSVTHQITGDDGYQHEGEATKWIYHFRIPQAKLTSGD